MHESDVDFYGIKVISNDIFVYTSIPDATSYEDPINPTVQGTIMIGENNFVSSDETQVDKPSKSKESNADDLELYGVLLSCDTLVYKDTGKEVKSSDVISGDKMKSSSGTWEDITELNTGSADSYGEDLDDKRQSLMAQDIIDWYFDTESQAQSMAAAKRETSAQLAARSSEDNSKNVAFVASHEFNQSEEGKSLRYFVDIYTCHTFNEADGKDSDWILVKQSGMLNPSAGYVNKAPENGHAANMSGYMVYYEFTNWLEDSDGKELRSNQASIQQASPDSTNDLYKMQLFNSCNPAASHTRPLLTFTFPTAQSRSVSLTYPGNRGSASCLYYYLLPVFCSWLRVGEHLGAQFG